MKALNFFKVLEISKSTPENKKGIINNTFKKKKKKIQNSYKI